MLYSIIIRWVFGLAFLVILAVIATTSMRVAKAQEKLKLPRGLQENAAFIPDDNPQTPEKIVLGKMFFWDKPHSASGTVACVSCHQPNHGWSDPRQFSINFAGKPMPRHTPTILNRLFSDQQLWTGVRPTLEEQALKDINRTDEKVVEHLGSIPIYQQQFRNIFGHNLEPVGVAKAVAAYVRTIVSGNSPYDRFIAGDKSALLTEAQRGLALFEGKARCVSCHAGFNFSDESYRNIGVGMDKPNPDLGRYTVTKNETDKGAFKTPTLRDVARRGPFMHDGSEKTLEDVIAFYNRGGVNNPWLASDIKPLNLTAQEQEDLVAFLRSLTGEIDPEVAKPPTLPD
jgi:cytochrome c peroxidase